MELIAIGEPVLVGDIKVEVAEILIRSRNSISYKVVWWDGRTRKSEWLESFEVSTGSNVERLQIGFGAKAEDN